MYSLLQIVQYQVDYSNLSLLPDQIKFRNCQKYLHKKKIENGVVIIIVPWPCGDVPIARIAEGTMEATVGRQMHALACDDLHRPAMTFIGLR